MMILVVVLGFLFISSAWAEIYKWTDEKGGVHFTEDPATIPEKYQEKVKSRLTEEDLLTPGERARIKQEEDIKVKERRLNGSREDYQKRVKQTQEDRAREAKKQAEAERLDIRVSTRRFGTGYYVFTVEARNDGNLVKSISFTDFTLITEDNQSLPAETGTLTNSSQIQPGTRYSGTVEFRARKRAKTLVYNPTGETFSVP
jgi:hypothetical protein